MHTPEETEDDHSLKSLEIDDMTDSTMQLYDTVSKISLCSNAGHKLLLFSRPERIHNTDLDVLERARLSCDGYLTDLILRTEDGDHSVTKTRASFLFFLDFRNWEDYAASLTSGRPPN